MWAIGDDFCDDEYNSFECDFDGGDCCETNSNKEYCTECLCKENSVTSSGTYSPERKYRHPYYISTIEIGLL